MIFLDTRYDYFDESDASSKSFAVVEIGERRAPAHALVGRWTTNAWSCQAASGFCSRRMRADELFTPDGWTDAEPTYETNGTYDANGTFHATDARMVSPGYL